MQGPALFAAHAYADLKGPSEFIYSSELYITDDCFEIPHFEVSKNVLDDFNSRCECFSSFSFDEFTAYVWFDPKTVHKISTCFQIVRVMGETLILSPKLDVVGFAASASEILVSFLGIRKAF